MGKNRERGRIVIEVELEVPQEVVDGYQGLEVGNRIVMGALGSITLPSRVSVNRIQAVRSSIDNGDGVIEQVVDGRYRRTP